MDQFINFNSAVKKYGLLLGILFLLSLAIFHFDWLDFYDYETRSFDYVTYGLSRLFWMAPIALFWLFIAEINQNKKPAHIALIVYIIMKTYHAIDEASSWTNADLDWGFSNYEFWKSIILGALPFMAYTVLKYDRQWKMYLLILFPLVTWGLNYLYRPYNFVERIDDFLVAFDFKRNHAYYNPEEGGFSVSNSLVYLIGYCYYIVYFFLFVHIEQLLRSINSAKKELNRIDFEKFKTDNVSFSIIFWSIRLFIATSIFSQVDRDMEFRIVTSQYIEIMRIIFFCVSMYLLVSFYRNMVTRLCVKNNKYPGWQFFGLNTPIVNLFAWIIQISKPTKKLNISEALDGEIIEPKSMIADKVALLKERFLKKNRNQSIITFLVIILLLNLLFTLMFTNTVSSDSDGVTYVLFYLVMSIGILMWYYLKPSGSFYIAVFLGLFAIATILLRIKVASPYDFLPAIINVTLFHVLYHFNTYEIVDSNEDSEASSMGMKEEE